jgi:uracil-DNA glycosylase
MAKADKSKLLEQIKADIIKQNICPDLAQEATQLVFGDGNPDAELVFIGEAPGKNEDQQGLPFVGAAGKFLNEKAVFLPFLRTQLEVIKPKLVITLGRHSMDSLLPGQRISDCHGQPKRYNGQVYLPLFHPAAALYNGAMRQTLIDDFSKIPRVLAAI